MFKALFYPREVKFYTDNFRASVTNPMSGPMLYLGVSSSCLTDWNSSFSPLYVDIAHNPDGVHIMYADFLKVKYVAQA